MARRHKLLIETAKRSWAGANIQKITWWCVMVITGTMSWMSLMMMMTRVYKRKEFSLSLLLGIGIDAEPTKYVLAIRNVNGIGSKDLKNRYICRYVSLLFVLLVFRSFIHLMLFFFSSLSIIMDFFRFKYRCFLSADVWCLRLLSFLFSNLYRKDSNLFRK